MALSIAVHKFPDNSITALLAQLSAGNRDVEAELIPQIYDELRRLARHYIRNERGNHTLQPTALVHEAYAQLVQQPRVPWQNRAHFFATASVLMRHILVDYARSRQAGKRGGAQKQITLDDAILPHDRSAQTRAIDVLAINEALERLSALDHRQARVVELHFFGGLTFDEIAHVLNIAERTAKRDWSMARAYLKGELAK
jgi:RNA polymerase sigma-70 factor (ECF subfamily)